EFALRVAKPCGIPIWKKSGGSALDGRRVASTVARIAASCGIMGPTGRFCASTGCSGRPLDAAQVLYSIAVIAAGLVPVPNGSASVVSSVGKVPKPGGVLPVLT